MHPKLHISPPLLEKPAWLENYFRRPDEEIWFVEVVRRVKVGVIFNKGEVGDGDFKLISDQNAMRVEVPNGKCPSNVRNSTPLRIWNKMIFLSMLPLFFKFFALQNVLFQIFGVVIHFDFYEILIVIPHYLFVRVHLHDVVVLVFPAEQIEFKLFVFSGIVFDLYRSAHQMLFWFLKPNYPK